MSQADIDATRPGGPSRTIMMWWQFTQYRVVNDGLALFTPEAQRQLKRAGYANFVPAYLGPWLRNGKPQVQRVALPDPKHATVYMQTTFVAPVSTDVVRKNEDVLAFTLEQRKGKWLLSDPSWFIAQANTLRTAAERPPAPAPRAQG